MSTPVICNIISWFISANEELCNAFASSKDGSIRVIKIGIENGMLAKYSCVLIRMRTTQKNSHLFKDDENRM